VNYRADIDGIRAIAVSIVILFHYGIPGFSGGYIGVDVFFVLSGYLISSIIFSQLEKGRFTFSTFYFRRIRRLFPVVIVVMLVTSALGYTFMLPKDFREFGQSFFASTVYMSNILFYLEAGYFDTASHLKPLLHTWSLSVEEQFYLVFPFVAWATASLSRRSLFTLFSLLALASLVAAVLYIDRDNSAVFYLYPFRAWEMFLGTMLATRVVPTIQSRRLSTLAASIGVALIAVPSVIYDDQTLFPGVSACLPCMGTVLLIHSGSGSGGWVQQMLSSRIAVFIGKISYSLYLWHWPIYVLYSYSKPHGTNNADIAIMAVATFVASVISWKFIETPFREGKVIFSGKKSVVFTSTAVISAMFMLAGLHIHSTNGLPGRLDSQTATFAKAGADLFGDLSGCESEDNSTLPDIAYCAIGDPFNADSYTLIWGDSHGGAYKRGYSSFVQGKDHHALLAWMGGCPPVFGLNKNESVSSKVVDEQCPRRNQAVRKMIEQDKRINAIVLVGRWSYYLNGRGVGVDDHNRISVWPEGSEPGSVSDQSQYFVNALIQTLGVLNTMGYRVFVVEQPPEFTHYVARTLAIGLMNGSSDFERSINTLAVESYDAVLARQAAVQHAFAKAEAEGKLTLLRTHDFFCNESNCSLMLDDVPTYFDNNHVSSFGAVQINRMFSPLVNYLDSVNK